MSSQPAQTHLWPTAPSMAMALAGPIAPGAHVMPLIAGRAAAGGAYGGTVPTGVALRVLTGARAAQRC